jgi:hypothetical protein
MALKTLIVDELDRLSTCLQNTPKETLYSLQPATDTKPLDASCIKHGSHAQTALGQLFSQESSDWSARNRISVMNAGDRALEQLGKCLPKPEYKSTYTNVWYDEAAY